MMYFGVWWRAEANLRPGSVQGRRAPNTDNGRSDKNRRHTLGFSRADIANTIQAMRRTQFYKSMTSYGNHRIWQDVYHVPSEVGTLYVKFTADAVTEFVLLSFKEKGDD
jgi:hypothetical protein